ncbi:MAG: ABC transporter substrate-binding protein [Chlorobi bacterium]|nr:ABC transporter substrate-binding protein [Chlorobiota bacterium]
MKIVKILLVLSVIVSSCTSTAKKTPDKNNGIRIVSLAPSITKEIEELGMSDHIVGATSYCDITKDNKDLIIGDAINVNIEKVLLLKPDIVLTTPMTRKSTLDLFRENGIKVYVEGKQYSFRDICKHFKELGTQIGRRGKAMSIIGRARTHIDSICEAIPESAKGQKIFIQIGAEPLFAVIPNTFMDDYIKFAGCENVTYGFKKGTISRETILERNPDVILIATMGITAQEEKKNWESYKELNAAKNGKVFIIDANVACVPTVKNFEQAFEDIVRLIVK